MPPADAAPRTLGWFIALFIGLMACIVIYPQLHGLVSDVVVRGCWQLTLVCALLALAVSWSELGIIVALLSLDSLMLWAESEFWSASGQVLEVGVRAYIIYRIIRFVFGGTVTANSIFAAVCVYLMIGFFFGQIFCLIGTLQGHSPLLDTQGGFPSTEEIFYFSFSALTTAGFGDVRPATPALSVDHHGGIADRAAIPDLAPGTSGRTPRLASGAGRRRGGLRARRRLGPFAESPAPSDPSTGRLGHAFAVPHPGFARFRPKSVAIPAPGLSFRLHDNDQLRPTHPHTAKYSWGSEGTGLDLRRPVKSRLLVRLFIWVLLSRFVARATTNL